MELIALKKLTYGGTRYFAGDRFSTRSKDGKALCFLRKAIVAPNFATPTLPEVEFEYVEDEAVEEVVEEVKPKRTYKRRDMVAEK